MPHSKQFGFNRDVINPQEGHILCDRNPATCGFSLRVLWSSRIVNSAIRRPKRILIAFISVLLLGCLPAVQAAGRVSNRERVTSLAGEYRSKSRCGAASGWATFLYTDIRLHHQRNKTTPWGGIVPSYLLRDYSVAYLVTAQNCSGLNVLQTRRFDRDTLLLQCCNLTYAQNSALREIVC